MKIIVLVLVLFTLLLLRDQSTVHEISILQEIFCLFIELTIIKKINQPYVNYMTKMQFRLT